ncbi:DUF3426 domain-containing protein [Lysobacter sp. GCM10012299]|uniref:DUF3426 domain-containing protein n=1 Tax=Lysobacter sp. GCM10012299 TaxID=3317333 RepID=UPI00361CE6DF
MFVPCPHCGFLVALIAARDRAAQRCPRCEGLVQAPDMVDADMADTVVAADAVPSTAVAGAEVDAVEAEAPSAAELPVDTATAAAPADALAADTATAPDTAQTFEQAIEAAAIRPAAARRQRRGTRPRRQGEPSFASRHAAAANARLHWRWYAALAGLVVLLVLQLMLAQRRELAADARWRPYVSALCTLARCELPPWHEPAAFTMIQRNVRAKPGSAGVLAVEASFRNDAHWPQPWPTLLLGLSDVDGRLAGQRAFTPGEYRPDQKATDVLLPGQSATVTLDVIEPAPRIVAFTFDFR